MVKKINPTQRLPKQSAGILLYRVAGSIPEVLLIHPGGPFWAKKDDGSWSIPKGEYENDEDPLQAARREFKEETGKELQGRFIPLKPVKQKGGKIVHAFALKGDLDTATVISNTFSIEWPPKSGRMKEFPEIDRCEWFDIPTARIKMNEAQSKILDELEEILNA